jgi:hypothetical protein
MLAKAPPSLHERVVALLRLVAADARVCYDLRAFAGPLGEGLARAAGARDAAVRLSDCSEGKTACSGYLDADSGGLEGRLSAKKYS